MDTSPSLPEDSEAPRDPLEGLDLDAMSQQEILDLIDDQMVLEMLRQLKASEVSLATLEQARKILAAKGHVRTSLGAKAGANPTIRATLQDIPKETLREQGITLDL